MKPSIALIALALAGCKTTAEPVVEVREVLVPTPVSCVKPDEIPPEPPTVAQRFNGDARHDLQVLVPSAQALRKWGQDMHAMLERCAAIAPRTAEPETVD